MSLLGSNSYNKIRNGNPDVAVGPLSRPSQRDESFFRPIFANNTNHECRNITTFSLASHHHPSLPPKHLNPVESDFCCITLLHHAAAAATGFIHLPAIFSPLLRQLKHFLMLGRSSCSISKRVARFAVNLFILETPF
jgi:hypothetical protein